MYSNDENKIRAFPFRPVAQPSGLTDYIELSGCNNLLIEAVKKLYEVPNKPENPIEWLRLYFKYQAEDVTTGASPSTGIDSSGNEGSDFTQDLEEVELVLKGKLALIEADIITCFEEESQNKAVIEKIDNELKRVTLNSTKNSGHDDFLKYLEHGDDYHYRIRPDPLYQPSKTDMLLERNDANNRAGLGVHGHGGGGGFGGGAPLKQEDSMVELVPFNSQLWTADGQSGHLSLKKVEEEMIYKDYPKLYFSERQKEEIGKDEGEVGVGSVEQAELEEADEEDEEVDETFSGSEGKDAVGRGGGVGMGSDYDGGSEGGESDQSRPVLKQAQYTPRSAHDRKHRGKQSPKSQLKDNQ